MLNLPHINKGSVIPNDTSGNYYIFVYISSLSTNIGGIVLP